MGALRTKPILNAELCARGIDTSQEVLAFRRLARRRGDMLDVLGAIRNQRGGRVISRKKQRHDALDLIREGKVFAGC